MATMLGYADIAKRIKVDATTVRRLIARVNDELKIQLHRGKGDKVLISDEDANKLIAYYEARRGPIEAGDDTSPASFDRCGFFYVIQLVPEALPNRVKIGYADDVERRLAEHRTAAPTARLLKSWPCKRSWDYAAMDAITRDSCQLVLNEVYEGDIDGFLARADEFFRIMPNPGIEKELSAHSPLYEADEQ